MLDGEQDNFYIWNTMGTSLFIFYLEKKLFLAFGG